MLSVEIPSLSSAWQAPVRDTGGQEPQVWLSQSVHGKSTFSGFSEQVATAAELAGARARGPVAAALRRKAEQRHAYASAFRRRVFLGGDCESEYIEDGGVGEGLAVGDVGVRGVDGQILGGDGHGNADLLGDSLATPKISEARGGDEDITDHSGSMSGSSEEFQDDARVLPDELPYWLRGVEEPVFDEGAKKRTIKVARGTCLGRMVHADPRRAKQYRLISVPAWTLNKPWPPPPVPIRRRMPGGLPDLRSAAKQGVANADARVAASPRHTHQDKHGPPKGKEVPIEVPRSSSLYTQMSSKDSTSGPEASNIKVDLEIAESLLMDEDVDHYCHVFWRFTLGTAGRMFHKGLQLAMKVVGLGFPESRTDQMKVRAVQEEVLRQCRPQDCEEPSPLTSTKGSWTLEEFVLMIAGVYALERHDKFSGHQELARDVKLELHIVQQLEDLFKETAVDNGKTISFSHFQRILAKCNLRPTQEELRVIFTTEVQDEIVFEDFARYIGDLNAFMPIDLDSLLAPSEDAPSSTMIAGKR